MYYCSEEVVTQKYSTEQAKQYKYKKGTKYKSYISVFRLQK